MQPAAGLKTLCSREASGVLFVAIALAVMGSPGLAHAHAPRGCCSTIWAVSRRHFRVAHDAGPEGPSDSDEVERLRRVFMQLAEQIRGQMQELQR
jgi:nitrogenase molybdenum-iron protein alpha/beta subunit